MEQIVVEQIGADKFRLSIDATPSELTEDGLRSELQKQLHEHHAKWLDVAEMFRDTKRLCRIEVNYRISN